jgi:hypothetical protein
MSDWLSLLKRDQLAKNPSRSHASAKAEPSQFRTRLRFMKQSAHNDPAYWRARAEECRKVAAQLDDASRKTMLEIAHCYDRLATLAQKNRVAPS